MLWWLAADAPVWRQRLMLPGPVRVRFWWNGAPPWGGLRLRPWCIRFAGFSCCRSSRGRRSRPWQTRGLRRSFPGVWRSPPGRGLRRVRHRGWGGWTSFCSIPPTSPGWRTVLWRKLLFCRCVFTVKSSESMPGFARLRFSAGAAGKRSPLGRWWIPAATRWR